MNNQHDLFPQFNTNDFRTAEIGGEMYMSAVDACQGVGYQNPRQDWRKLKTRNPELAELSVVTNLVTTDGKRYQTDVLALDGITMLCMLARTDRARSFRRWAAGVLKREIEQRQQRYHIPQTYGDALREAANQFERAERAEQRVAELEPKASGWDRYLEAEGYHTMSNIAKRLGTGRTRLFRKLRELQIIPEGSTIPHQRYIDAEYFVVRAKTQERTDGSVSTYDAAAMTPRGFDWLVKLLRQNGALVSEG